MSNSSEKQESVVISCTGSESIDYRELRNMGHSVTVCHSAGEFVASAREIMVL
jgi:hypothetical protein